MKNLKFLYLIILATTLFGFSFTSKNASTVKTSVFSSPDQQSTTITGSDISKTVTLDGGTLIITGSNNSINVKGFASKITVTGSDNTVSSDVVNSVSIVGSDNTVTYRSSKNKSKRANVSSTGSDNSVIKS